MCARPKSQQGGAMEAAAVPSAHWGCFLPLPLFWVSSLPSSKQNNRTQKCTEMSLCHTARCPCGCPATRGHGAQYGSGSGPGANTLLVSFPASHKQGGRMLLSGRHPGGFPSCVLGWISVPCPSPSPQRRLGNAVWPPGDCPITQPKPTVLVLSKVKGRNGLGGNQRPSARGVSSSTAKSFAGARAYYTGWLWALPLDANPTVLWSSPPVQYDLSFSVCI